MAVPGHLRPALKRLNVEFLDILKDLQGEMNLA